jgi:hypothetical protein
MSSVHRRQLALRRELLTMEIELQRWRLRADLAQARSALAPARLLRHAWSRMAATGTASGLFMGLWRWWRARRHAQGGHDE